MPTKAKFYIVGVLAAATAVLAATLPGWRPDAGPRFPIYLLLTFAAATWKVRLPGVPNTISIGFVMLLLTVTRSTVAEAAILAAVAALTQCLWRPKRRPLPIQVAFSVATLVISVALAGVVSPRVAAFAQPDSLLLLIAIAAALLYLSNTLLVATVVCLVEGRQLTSVWQQCHVWAFPYYIVGSLLFNIPLAAAAQAGWREALLLVPLLVLAHLCYRTAVTRWGSAGQAVAA